MTDNNQKKSDGNKGNDKKKNPYLIYWIYAAIGIAIIGVQLFLGSNPTQKIQSQRTFLQLMEDGYVENVTLWRNVGRVDFKLSDEGRVAINGGDYSGGDYDLIKRVLEGSNNSFAASDPKLSFDIASVESFLKDFDKVNDDREKNGFEPVSYRVDEEHNYIGQIFSFLLPIIIIVAIWMFIFRRMSGGIGGRGNQMFNIGKSKAQVFEKGKGTDVTFKDVAGLKGAKEEVQEIVDFLKNPKRYTA